MQDENLIGLTEDPLAPRDRWRAQYLARPLDRLPKDVTHAFDRLYRIERQNDELRQSLLEARRGQHKHVIWLGIVTAAAVAEFGVIGWLVSAFLDRLMK